MRPLRRPITILINMQLSTPQEVGECAAVSTALYKLTKIEKHTRLLLFLWGLYIDLLYVCRLNQTLSQN